MSLHDKQWREVCNKADLVNNGGVCLLLNEDTEEELQVALFCVNQNDLYAIGNYDPLGKANVLYRGIIGSLSGEPVVASPLYKQHFNLSTGSCLEDESVEVPAFEARLNNDSVELFC